MPSVLAYGRFSPRENKLLSESVATAGLDLVMAESVAQAEATLESDPPTTIILRGTGESVARLATQARARVEQRHVPILTMKREPDDLAFAEALNWGADDIVTLQSSRELIARLRAILRSPGPPSAARRGKAVVGEPERGRRVALARVLDAAGFEVKFVADCEEAREATLDLRVGLMVLSTSVCADCRAFVDQAREAGSMARLIVSSAPQELPGVAARLEGADAARAVDSSSPPENVVFVANEMASPELANKRASARELYGTSVRFRPEGHERDDIGYTYNVSAHGMFVRTLAAPTTDVVWLELEPPRVGRRVRLVGQVAWRRAFGPGGHATVPPGFGLKIIDGATSDVQLWEEGYSAPPAAMSIKPRK